MKSKLDILEEKLNHKFDEKIHTLTHKFQLMSDDLRYLEKTQYKNGRNSHGKCEKTIGNFMMSRNG